MGNRGGPRQDPRGHQAGVARCHAWPRRGRDDGRDRRRDRLAAAHGARRARGATPGKWLSATSRQLEAVARKGREIRPAVSRAMRGVPGADHHLGKVRPIGGHRAVGHEVPEAVGVEHGTYDVFAEDGERSHFLCGRSANSPTSGACKARMPMRCPSTRSVSPSSAAASPSTVEGCRASPA
jgi:hypothetical protein